MLNNIIFITLFSCIISSSRIFSKNDYTKPLQNPKSDHPLNKAWLLNALLGLTGFVLNCIVLNLCLKEWKRLLSSINAMIMYVHKTSRPTLESSSKELNWTRSELDLTWGLTTSPLPCPV